MKPDNSALVPRNGESKLDSAYAFPEITARATSHNDSEAKVLKALLERPGFSIRSRLILAFALFFLLSAGITIAAIIAAGRLENKLKFLEIADIFTNEIQQARRYEKNFFLYGSGLPSVLDHIDTAERLLLSARSELASVAGMKNMEIMERHLARYKELIAELESLDKNRSSPTSSEIENELRTHGAEMVSFALELSRKERANVAKMIELARQVPIVFLVLLLPLMIYVSNFLYHHIIGRLNRLMQVTQKISEGDLTPIMPTRRFRDEFTNLAVALNSMMYQINHRQEVLVRSHKLRAIGTLTAGIAHELNNPLNNIMLTAEMLKEDYHDLSEEEQFGMISDLITQAERAQKIVRNLLGFARESEIKQELVHVEQLIEETKALVANQLKLHKVKIALHVAPNLPPIHGDRQQLSQVFLNLILNALDAVPPGGKLEINVDRTEHAGFIAADVIDNGSGIPEHLLGNIFDPFFTTKASGKGTGLGLSVSLGIIRKHGGDIKVKSKVDEGTTFTVLLPVSEIPSDISSDNGESSTLRQPE